MLHFTPGTHRINGSIPVFVRGEGCHLWDSEGRRYLDGLAGLFVVQIGHGRLDIAQAVAEQMSNLAYSPLWSAAHPAAIEAAALIAGLAPGDLDSVFFVNSGSEAVESAIKFARQYHASQGNPGRTKVISRNLAYHGTTLGALSATGLDSIRDPFQPLLAGFRKVSHTLGQPDGVAAARIIEEAILEEGAESVGLVIAEPVQNGGGAIVPPTGYWAELRRICDRYGVLLCADEVICGFGRLGEWFGSELFGVVPDMITFAKGATSGYAPIGGLLIRRQRADELLNSPMGTFSHGATWGGHPVSTAAAIANIQALRRESVLQNVRGNASYFRGVLDSLRETHDVVSEVRGLGYFYAMELCQSRAGGRGLTANQVAEAVADTLPHLIADAGLLIRADDRGKLKLMLSPPLVATRAELDQLGAGVDQILERFGRQA